MADKDRSEVLISATELRERLAAGDSPAIIDVRWTLGQPDGSEDYATGHIPGATFIDLDSELADLSRTDALGRHPLPDAETLARLLAKLHGAEEIIAYDNWRRAGSSRVWWVLRAAGVKNVRVLDGGLQAWIDAGGELATGEAPKPSTGSQVSSITAKDLYAQANLPILDESAAARLAKAGALVDARASQRYQGIQNPPGEVPGHIPGAKNLPFSDVLNSDGTFAPPETIRAALDARGISGNSGAGAYCGSGITATTVILAAASVGRDVALFPGSWSQWTHGGANPTETAENA